MTTTVLWRLAATGACLGAIFATASAVPTASKEEMAEKNAWVRQHFQNSQAAEPPFSFLIGGKPSGEWLKTCEKKIESRKLDDARTQHILVWTDPTTRLEVRCAAVEYSNFPTIEWTVYLKNAGDRDTPLLSDVQALDTRLPGDDKFVLNYNNGTTVNAKDYQPLTADLQRGTKLTLSPTHNASGGVWPYFNLRYGDAGRLIVVGWPGQWAITFDHEGREIRATELHITAGQKTVRTTLRPGEQLRTPLMVQQFYRGDAVRAQNIWRRWMKAYGMPKPGGKLPPPQLNACSSHQFAEMINADEGNQKLFVDRYVEERLNLDYWWMDAGWYPCRDKQWYNTGTWEVDKNRFPNGLRAVSDHAHQKGVKIIVWFEPERLVKGTWLYENHKDWVIGDALLNLGNPRALQWAIDHFNRMIDDEGIDLYRQDYNVNAFPLWRANDAPDRQGMTENQYVVGYLAYWDGLLKKHPHLLIDSCSGGGHRNDLETMRRSIPLLRSDYLFEPTGQQCHTYGLAQWLPSFGTGIIAAEPYGFRSCMCPANTACWDVRRKDLDYNLLRKLTGQRKAVAGYYYGDYYPLTPYSLDNNVWMAWQFDCPESGEGMVQAFRRQDAPAAAMTFRLQGLDPDATYEVADLDAGTPSQVSGRRLREEGLAVDIKDRPGAAVITYRIVK